MDRLVRDEGSVLPSLHTTTKYVSPTGADTNIVYRENFAPVLCSPIFALLLEGEFKTGLIELFIKDYKRKLEIGEFKTGRISFRSIGLGEFKDVYSKLFPGF